MGNGSRIACLLLLAACAWIGADGSRRAGADVFARVHLPWDANRLPEDAPDARLLLLKPVSPFARFRDALSRSQGPDGGAFRDAGRGVLRWARNQPGLLLELGRVSLARARRLGEAETWALGEALLLEYTARTTHVEGEGLKAWLEFAGPNDDPVRAFGRAPTPLHPGLGALLADRRPDAAWRFLRPAVADGTLDARYVGTVAALARARKAPEDLPPLRALASRPDLDPAAKETLRALVADLERGR